MMKLHSFALLCMVFLGMLAMVGCGPSTATVSGTVSLSGKKLAWGTVTLVAVDGSTHTSEIARDGTYRISNVPTGTSTVGVHSPDPFPDGRKAKYEGRYKPPTDLPEGAWFVVPNKYADPKTSGITIDVGRSQDDIELK